MIHSISLNQEIRLCCSQYVSRSKGILPINHRLYHAVSRKTIAHAEYWLAEIRRYQEREAVGVSKRKGTKKSQDTFLPMTEEARGSGKEKREDRMRRKAQIKGRKGRKEKERSLIEGTSNRLATDWWGWKKEEDCGGRASARRRSEIRLQMA